MANIITRLLLDASRHDKGLEKAQRSLDKYIEKNVSAGNVIQGLAGTVGKMAGAVGLAMGATEAFNKVINSSQVAGDKYNETMEGLKASVDGFFTAISTGDFTSFTLGLDTVISKAREAYNALDQVGNAQMSFNVAQSINQRDISEGQLAAKNKFAPIDIRVAGFDKWKEAIGRQEGQSEQLASDIQRYILRAVEAEAGIKGFVANMNNTMKGLLLDIQNEVKRDELKTRYKSEYQEYTEAVKAAKAARDKEAIGKKPWERERLKAEREYNKRIKELADKYNEAITINALINKYSDEQLKTIGGYVTSMNQLDSSIGALKREYNETANEFNNANKSIKGFVPREAFEGYKVYSGGNQASTTFKGNTKNVEAAKGSIAYMQQELKKLQTEYANAATDAARMAAIKAIREMETNIRMMNRSAENPLTQGTPSFKQSLPNDLYKVNFKPLISQKDVTTTQDYTDSLNALANVMGAINTSSMQGAAGFLSWAASLMTATATAIESITKIVAAKTAEGAASAGAEAAKTPIVGWLLVGGAIASALAAFASIPSFAEGGVVPGANFRDGVAARLSSGEMVINPHDQKKLYDSIRRGEMGGGGGRAIVTGEQIVLAVNNYGKRSGKGVLIKS